jgi:hypothetical protein
MRNDAEQPRAKPMGVEREYRIGLYDGVRAHASQS